MDQSLTRGRELIEAMSDEVSGLRGQHGCIVSDEVPGFTVVAGVAEDGGPELTVYRNEEVAAWYERAAEYRRRYPRDSWITAMWETKK